MATSEGAFNVEARFNEGSDRYELGTEIDGAWHVFADIPGSAARATIENARANAPAEGDTAPPTSG